MPWKFCWQFTGQLNSQEVLQREMGLWLAGVDAFQPKKRDKMLQEDLNPVGYMLNNLPLSGLSTS